ncbi:MAG: hypothetical protein A2Y24_00595 [Clostridiales bacterium GWE2_32_10]|nr:MAG: hypothetical protein A2Y24_00595 [Clostridiales bacterium GWE2_32_10]HBY21241.1 hypothetical protein [Clostridiales bacterium]
MKKITISGSMKSRDKIKDTKEKLERLGFEALFPNLDYSEENGGVAESQDEKSKLAWDHFKAVEESNAVYFLLPQGYMGTSCKLELGYALALRKDIFFSEKTNDIGLDSYPKAFIDIDNLEYLRDLIESEL